MKSPANILASASISEIAQFLHVPTNRVDVNYGLRNGGARAVCMGDWHVGYSVKDEFIRIMPELKTQGLTHVAFELLSTDMQPLLDRYHALWNDRAVNQSEINTLRSELVKHFYQVWGDTSDKDEQLELRAMSHKLTDMIDAAVAECIQIIAIEPPVPRPFGAGGGYALLHKALEQLGASVQSAFDQYWANATSELDLARSRESLLSELVSKANWKTEDANHVFEIFDVIRKAQPAIDLKGFTLPRPKDQDGDWDQPWQDLIASWRDRTWTLVVENALNQPETQVLVFAGSGHFGYAVPNWPETKKASKSFNEILKENGHEVIVIGFAGGDYPRKLMVESQEEFGCPVSQDMIFTDAAIEGGVSNQTFAVALQQSEPRGSDWVVHLARSPEL